MLEEPSERDVPRATPLETLLVVEGNEFARHRLKAALRADGREVYLCGSAREALEVVHEVKPDLMFVSLDLGDLPGIRALDVFQERAPGTPVVALTETPTVDGAVEATRHGAANYLSLTEQRARLLEVVHRALQERASNRDLQRVREEVRDSYGFSTLLSQSPRMLQVFDEVRRVAATEATVLIRGETGTGKELVSREIHEKSARREKPFISVNCGAFTETLLESELFGHEKGSFTGAVGRREGLFEMADSGSLFLDELGETTANTQVNLLRVLEEMTFRRVGGREQVRVDVRIIAATNVDLETAVQKKQFREDLFYRLNVFPILLPPLRERTEDIPMLMRHFLDEIADEYGMDPPVISKEALDAILAYRWPGNVRQLRTMCERWVITRASQRLELEHLPPDMTGRSQVTDEVSPLQVNDLVPMKDNTDRVVSQVERAYLHRLLKRHEGHLENTAKFAGITRRTLYTKMKQYGLDARDYRD